MVKKFLKGAAVVTGCFLAATAAGTAWLTGTESGLKTVVSAVRAALPAFSSDVSECGVCRGWDGSIGTGTRLAMALEGSFFPTGDV